MTIADVLPEFHHREHHSIHVRASPDDALAAAKAITLADVPLLRTLFRLRGLGTPPQGSLWEAMGKNGFQVADENTIVLIGRPWRITGGRRPEVVSFAEFAEPRYAKMGLDLTAVPEGDGARLATETRVFLTDRSAQRRFLAYWLVIRLFSGLTRRSWLRAAKRRAEK